MRIARVASILALLGVLAALVGACSRPQPPRLTPKHATISSVSPEALGVDLTLDATNPNAVDLPVRNVSGRVVIDKTIQVGATTVDQTVTLPANQTTEINLTLSIPWTDLVPLAGLATSDRRWIPYTLDGTVGLGGDLVNVRVPFKIEGNVSREQIMRAAVSALPAIPGIPPIPGIPAIPTVPSPPRPVPPGGTRPTPHTTR